MVSGGGSLARRSEAIGMNGARTTAAIESRLMRITDSVSRTLPPLESTVGTGSVDRKAWKDVSPAMKRRTAGGAIARSAGRRLSLSPEAGVEAWSGRRSAPHFGGSARFVPRPGDDRVDQFW